jgi:hypothetical protein
MRVTPLKAAVNPKTASANPSATGRSEAATKIARVVAARRATTGSLGTRAGVGAIEREHPEMRRRPQEDDQEQHERRDPDLSRRC